MSPRPEARHRQDDGGEVGAQDLRVGELGTAVEVVLGVEPDRDAVGDPAAAAGPLVGRRLAHRLDRQPLHLRALAVAADARRAGVDDIADAWDGEGGLGDVGGENDAPARVRSEDPVLLGGGEPTVERHDLRDRQPHPAQRVGRVTYLPLAGEEDEDVAAGAGVPLGPQLLDGIAHAGDHVAFLVLRSVGVDERAVADLDGKGAPGHLDDRRWLPARRVGEVVGETLRVDRRRGDDHLELGTPREELSQVAEDEVDVEAALVGLVDDDRVIATQLAVPLHLGQQDPVGHDLDERVAAALVAEAHLVAHGRAQLDAELVAEPLGHRTGGDAAWLRVTDDAVEATAELEADLRDLGGLARAGLARDHHDLVVADGSGDVVAPVDDGQVLGIGDRRDGRGASGPACRSLPGRQRPPLTRDAMTRGGAPALGRRLDRPRSAASPASTARAGARGRGLLGHDRQDRWPSQEGAPRFRRGDEPHGCPLVRGRGTAHRARIGRMAHQPSPGPRGAMVGWALQRPNPGVPVSDTRPGLPDPQQDRHVAFPDLGADSAAPGNRSSSSANGSPPPAPAGPALPPDAWARRDSRPAASAPRQTAQPPILHQPSTRPPRTPRRRWIPTLAIIAIFIAMGHANDHGGRGMHAPDGSYSQQEWSGSDPDDVYDASN